jgi:hypothetical protein
MFIRSFCYILGVEHEAHVQHTSNHKLMTVSQLLGVLLLSLITACGCHKCSTFDCIRSDISKCFPKATYRCSAYIQLQSTAFIHIFRYSLHNLPGNSISINWQYAAPVHSSSILVKFDAKQSLTHANISCRLRFSVVTFVEYTLTAAIIKTGNIKYTYNEQTDIIYTHGLKRSGKNLWHLLSFSASTRV